MLSNYLTQTNKKKLKQIKEVLQADSFINFTVQTDSMFPSIKPGDSIQLEKRTPRIGDIIAVFLTSGDVLVHRYLGEIGEFNLTKGDNSNRRELSSPTMLLGRVKGPPSIYTIIKSCIQLLFFKLKYRCSQNTAHQIKQIAKNPLVRSCSYLDNKFNVSFFDIYSFNLLSLANTISKYWGNNSTYTTLELANMTTSQALTSLENILQQSTPWDENNAARAYFYCHHLYSESSELLLALSETLLTENGRNKWPSALELIETVKKSALAQRKMKLTTK